MNTDDTRNQACPTLPPLRKFSRRGRPSVPADDLPPGCALLRRQREARDLTLAQVGQRLNASPDRLSVMERGKADIAPTLLEAWAIAIGLDPAEVLCAFRVVPDRAAARFFDPDRMRAALKESA